MQPRRGSCSQGGGHAAKEGVMQSRRGVMQPRREGRIGVEPAFTSAVPHK